MKTHIFMAALVALLAAGCTTASGPTYSVDTITANDGEKAYQAQCYGLFTSGKACVKAAEKICNGKPVSYLQAAAHGVSTPSVGDNAREIIFRCGEPVVANVAPPVKPAPAALAPVRQITLRGDANFATDSAALTPTADSTLDKFIADSRNADIALITISGHTDSTGSTALNDRLSKARARSVETYLRSHGLQALRYEVHGYGSSRPVASNNTPGGRAMNRRVQIDVTAQSQ